jgi:4-hydroxy-tetrahydrodipicolinate reductase
VIDLVISGIRGRMGQALVRLARHRPDVRIVAGIGRAAAGAAAAERCGCPRIAALGDAADVADAVKRAGVVVDVSAAGATRTLLESAGNVLAGRALLVGTTGLDAATERLLADAAQHAAVLQAANFSIGVNLLLSLAERVAAVLDEVGYDAEIIETHHRRKTDAPSGTALALGAAVARGRGRSLPQVRRDGRSGDAGRRTRGELGFHAVRGGGVVGDHTVLFIGERERVELRHSALHRELFAEGALAAAVWLAGRDPGKYDMAQVLGL